MRDWMRAHSSVWQRFDPPPPPPIPAPEIRCGSCASVVDAAADERHRIGTYWEGGRSYATFCDGMLRDVSA